MESFMDAIRKNTTVVKSTDKLYNIKYGNEEAEKVLKNRPHRTDPKFFKKAKISLMALIKMLNHAQMGGNNEVMGYFSGENLHHIGYYTMAGEFIVLDSVALPVEATETTVNAGLEADNFTIQHSELIDKMGGFNYIGWYHSHPSYGCWLSRIDVSTQSNYQMSPEPWLAIVIDPIRTVARERVEIGAFRTYPPNYTPPEDKNSGDGPDVPLKKIAQFGVNYNKYYVLQVELFQNDLDNNIIESLMRKYWVGHLSSSPFYGNISYYRENIEQVHNCCKDMCRREFCFVVDNNSKKKEANLKKVLNKTLEKNQALIGEAIKNSLF